MHHVPVNPVLDVRRAARGAEDPLVVRLVLAEQHRHVAGAVQPAQAQLLVLHPDHRGPRSAGHLPQARDGGPTGPRPGVPEPQRRQQMQPGLVRPPVVHGDLDQHVVGRRLGVLDEHVEVAVLGEDAGVQQLVLEIAATARPVGRHQVGVRVRRLWILVQELQVRMGRGAVQVEVVLLDVLAVVPLAVGQPEHPLLQQRVAAVPQRQREAQPLLVVADAGDAVLTPPVRPRPCLVMAEVRPGVPVAAVVLPDRAPLPLAQVRTPPAPRHPRLVRLYQPLPLRALARSRTGHSIAPHHSRWGSQQEQVATSG